MKKDDERLHVAYIPKLITKRKEKVIRQYVERFYSPYIFILWILVAFDINDCVNMVYIVPLLTCVSALHSTYRKYHLYYKDLVYVMQNENIEVDVFTKCQFCIFEIVIQFFTTFIAFFWVDEVHTCLFDLNRVYQSYLFVTVIVVTFILHVGHYQQTKKLTEYFVRTSYSHVGSEIDI
jgi:hypothetical protein